MTASETAARRLHALMGHLSMSDTDSPDLALAAESASGGLTRQDTAALAVRSLPRFDVGVMEAYLDDLRSMKLEVYELLRQHPELLPATLEGMTKETQRALVRGILKVILEAGYSPMKYFAKDYKKYFYLAELCSLVDVSAMVKMGVQYSLWGGSIVNLGTERHHAKYFDDIDTFRLPGCFAMTEMEHGSNVSALQTEATLDLSTDEWVVHTPNDGAIKWWIGNAAEDGLASTVFARLKVPAPDGSGAVDDHGVHAFVVPLRDANNRELLPGVEIRDCGYKVGLNGVDNGAIRFTHVRVPRDNLLDRFASVDKSGRYSSPLPSAGKRFAATLGELTGGRVGLMAGSLGILKGAVTIAIRYSAQRQQFGPPDGAEIAVLDYQTQQRKLLPMLATTYALHFAKNLLVDKFVEAKRTKEEEIAGEVHSLSAGLKAYTTTYTAMALNVCRESCGGHGYAAVNRLGALRSDHDIFQTFEGDNTVLLQQVSATLLKKYKEKFAGGTMTASYVYLREWAVGAVPPNPLITHATGAKHLRDPSFLKRALRYRVGRLLRTVAARLNKHTGQVGAFHAWNKCLNHLLELANAHIEATMLDAFYNGVNGCVDPDARKALKAMADLFALQCIQKEVLFRNDEYMTPEKMKAIMRLSEVLMAELRGIAVPLVDVFAIPDHILRAPIGLKAASSKDPYGSYLKSVGW